MGINDCIRVLCDLSYLERLCELKKKRAAMKNGPHSAIADAFGVQYVSLRTTWCVFDEIQCKLKDAKDAETKSFMAEVKKYALGIDKNCPHVHEPINSWDCIKSILETEVIDPNFFGTGSDKRQRKTKKRYGLPVITVQPDGMLSVKPPSKTQEKKLAALKEKRSAALKLGGNSKKDKVDFEKIADVYVEEMKEATRLVKRKRNPLRKKETYPQYFKRIANKQTELESKRKGK